MGPSRRAAGFSLIELMVVVTLVSIIVLLFRPSFSKYYANKHTVAAASEIVRLGRQARAESVGTKRAYLLYFQPGVGATRPFGTVTLLRGNAMHCDHEVWQPFLATCTNQVNQPPNSPCVARIDLSSDHWYHDPHAIVLRPVPAGQEANHGVYMTIAPPAASAVQSLCYDAFGNVFWSMNPVGAGGMVFSSSSIGAGFRGAFTFGVGLGKTTDTMTSNTGVGGSGIVISFPLGGNPRRLR